MLLPNVFSSLKGKKKNQTKPKIHVYSVTKAIHHLDASTAAITFCSMYQVTVKIYKLLSGERKFIAIYMISYICLIMN